MAFQLGDDDNGGMNEINLIPLIDIMLVLMIIFLVTATVMKPSIPLTLPETNASTMQKKQSSIIQVSIDKNNTIYIDKTPYGIEVFTKKLNQISTDTAQANLPSLNIRADKDSNYNTIAKVLAAASTAGLTDIAFISDSQD